MERKPESGEGEHFKRARIDRTYHTGMVHSVPKSTVSTPPSSMDTVSSNSRDCIKNRDDTEGEIQPGRHTVYACYTGMDFTLKVDQGYPLHGPKNSQVSVKTHKDYTRLKYRLRKEKAHQEKCLVELGYLDPSNYDLTDPEEVEEFKQLWTALYDRMDTWLGGWRRWQDEQYRQMIENM